MPGEGRGLSSRRTRDVVRDWRLGNLTTPKTVQKLQTALHAKAKGDPKFRFYALYDKVYREDVLSLALRRCRHNDGKAGVDGQTFEDIAKYGEKQWLGELAEELRTKTYQPQAVRRRPRCAWYPASPSRMANSGRWAFRRSKTGSCKRPC